MAHERGGGDYDSVASLKPPLPDILTAGSFIYTVFIMPRPSSSGNNPGASQQTKFRAIPRRSYSERMSETRAEIRRIVKEALSTCGSIFAMCGHRWLTSALNLGAITQDPNASMRWPSYWKDIVVKYHVIIEGWPHDEVPFRNLSDVSNLQKLDILLRGWQAGQIYFRRLSDEEFAILSAARAGTVDDSGLQSAGNQDMGGAVW